MERRRRGLENVMRLGEMAQHVVILQQFIQALTLLHSTRTIPAEAAANFLEANVKGIMWKEE